MRLRILSLSALGLLLLVALAAIGFALYGDSQYRAARTRFSDQFGEPDLAALSVPSVPTEANAATWLLRGAEKLSDESSSWEVVTRLSGLPANEWTSDDSEAATIALDERRESLALLGRAAACESGSFEIQYPLGMEATVPDYLSLLRATRLLLVDARGALLRGDPATALVDLNVLASAIATTNADSLLVATIIAQAMDRQYLSLVRDLLSTYPENEAIRSHLRNHLNRRDLEAGWRRGMRGEGAIVSSFGTAERLRQSHLTTPSIFGAAVKAPFERLFQAAQLLDYAELGEALNEPLPDLRRRVDLRLESPRFWSSGSFMLANVADSASKLKGLQSSYRLARTALRFADNGEIPNVENDPFTGMPTSVAHQEDGGLVISAPGAEDLWRELFAPPAGTNPPPFHWVIPGE